MAASARRAAGDVGCAGGVAVEGDNVLTAEAAAKVVQVRYLSRHRGSRTSSEHAGQKRSHVQLALVMGPPQWRSWQIDDPRVSHQPLTVKAPV